MKCHLLGQSFGREREKAAEKFERRRKVFSGIQWDFPQGLPAPPSVFITLWTNSSYLSQYGSY